MYRAFTKHPNYAPYNVQPNEIQLNLGAPGGPTPSSSANPAERNGSAAQGIVPADMRSVYAAWMAWSRQQVAQHHFDGPDRVNPEQLNRFDWYSAHNWRVAYPGDPKIYTPNQVPGRNLPAAFLGDN